MQGRAKMLPIKLVVVRICNFAGNELRLRFWTRAEDIFSVRMEFNTLRRTPPFDLSLKKIFKRKLYFQYKDILFIHCGQIDAKEEMKNFTSMNLLVVVTNNRSNYDCKAAVSSVNHPSQEQSPEEVISIYLDEVEMLDDVESEDDVDAELEVDTLKW
ncbi:hypothetical protein P5673_026402 [Acropora cervicornis]|uniref:Uncharacterized protein n=1 Tax=Acropora cervicornis TaxID=6130 RepID=A0AAD9Q0I6_ACRCE|nr:hypothetical protein P5673_026402 [Acropora cervicornis]